MKKRIDWVDETKGWGILCIMMAHVFQYFQATLSLNAYICSFHVPIFFVVTGCLDYAFRDKEFDFRKRTWALLEPYVVFSLINFVLKVLVYGFMHKLSAGMIKSELLELFITGNGTVWFLLTLWILNVFTQYVFKRICSRWMMLLIGVLMFVVAYSVHIPENPVMILLIRPVVALGYWTMGYLFFDIVDRTSEIGLWGFLLLVSGALVAWTNEICVNIFCGIFKNGISSVAASLLSSFGYILFFCWISKRQLFPLLQRFLLFFGKNSLIVMLIHPIWLHCFMYPFSSWFGTLKGMESGMMSILVYVAIVILEVPSIWIMNKYFGVLLGKK